MLLREESRRPPHATAARSDELSRHILEKCGFRCVGFRMEEETDRFIAREIAEFVLESEEVESWASGVAFSSLEVGVPLFRPKSRKSRGRVGVTKSTPSGLRSESRIGFAQARITFQGRVPGRALHACP